MSHPSDKWILMVSVQEDRDSLTCLWTRDVKGEVPDVVVLRFTHVFGINSNPFLLNATINHHMQRYQEIDLLCVENFFVDDVSFGSNDVESSYEPYLKSKFQVKIMTFRSWIQVEEIRDQFRGATQLSGH